MRGTGTNRRYKYLLAVSILNAVIEIIANEKKYQWMSIMIICRGFLKSFTVNTIVLNLKKTETVNYQNYDLMNTRYKFPTSVSLVCIFLNSLHK